MRGPQPGGAREAVGVRARGDGALTNAVFPPGNTYDRSIMVDGEEASLVVFDIWEQVLAARRYFFFMDRSAVCSKNV